MHPCRRHTGHRQDQRLLLQCPGDGPAASGEVKGGEPPLPGLLKTPQYVRGYGHRAMLHCLPVSLRRCWAAPAHGQADGRWPDGCRLACVTMKIGNESTDCRFWIAAVRSPSEPRALSWCIVERCLHAIVRCGRARMPNASARQRPAHRQPRAGALNGRTWSAGYSPKRNVKKPWSKT